MAIKPENNFIKGVHARLDPSVYRMKTNNPYIAGIPDYYYSGPGGDLWAEYKFIPKLPATVPVKIELSKLQRHWLEGRHAEGRNVAVIVGSPEGALVLLVPQLDMEITAYDFRERMVAPQYIAEWIAEQTM